MAKVCVCVSALCSQYLRFLNGFHLLFFFQQKLKTNQGEAAFHAHSLKRTHAQAGKGPSSLKSIHVYFFFLFCFSSGVFKLLSFALCCRLCVGLCVYVCVVAHAQHYPSGQCSAERAALRCSHRVDQCPDT